MPCQVWSQQPALILKIYRVISSRTGAVVPPPQCYILQTKYTSSCGHCPTQCWYKNSTIVTTSENQHVNEVSIKYAYMMYVGENLKKSLPASLLQIGLVQLHHFSTHVDDLLYLQLHKVRSPDTVHASNPCWWLAVPTAAHSTCF
jgi:hypothetical protein